MHDVAPPAAQPPAPQPIPVPEGPVVNRQELEGGLIIEDIKIGDGYEVKPGGSVVAHYHGTLREGGKTREDGTVLPFDSSFERGTPAAFPLSNVIQGWQKGVPGMKVGGIRRLIIPAALGYGERGAGGSIPPNADLVFVIQLVDALQIEEVKEGEGEAAEGQFVAVTAHTIKDDQGNTVEKRDASDPYIWIPREFQPIDMGVTGMKKGGIRKIHVPKEMNQATPMANPERPANVPLDIEIELLALRNLRPPQPRGQ